MKHPFSLNPIGSRFRLGCLLATPAALATLKAADVPAVSLVLRHMRGDWGELCQEDRQQNEMALHAGMRVLSNYVLSTGKRVWVITEADRSATTVLLPDDY